MKRNFIQDDCSLPMILTHYTSLLQPYDDGINKPLTTDWRNILQRGVELDTIHCVLVKTAFTETWGCTKLAENIWDSFPIKIVKNSITCCGQVAEAEFNYRIRCGSGPVLTVVQARV